MDCAFAGLVFFDWLIMVLIFVGPSSSGCVEPRVVLDAERRMYQSASCDDTENLLYNQYVDLLLCKFCVLVCLALLWYQTCKFSIRLTCYSSVTKKFAWLTWRRVFESETVDTITVSTFKIKSKCYMKHKAAFVPSSSEVMFSLYRLLEWYRCIYYCLLCCLRTIYLNTIWLQTIFCNFFYYNNNIFIK